MAWSKTIVCIYFPLKKKKKREKQNKTKKLRTVHQKCSDKTGSLHGPDVWGNISTDEEWMSYIEEKSIQLDN